MKIMILDANSLLNRSFYGIRLLSNKNGVYTNAVYGFLTTYIRLFSDIKPDGVCVCFDLKAPTFRHKEYEDYKAGRRPMPDELVSQIPLTKKILDLMGIQRFELAGYEADDLIGTISRIVGESGNTSVIVTGDRDSLQLIDESTTVKLITTKSGQTITTDYTKELFAENYCGLEPEAIIDLKGLSGDKSDNIPGVAGIGDKTALELLCRFRSVDGIYENIDSPDIRESVRKKLIADEESARRSYNLAKIDRTVPISFTPDMSVIHKRKENELYELFCELELKSLISKFSIMPKEECIQKTKKPEEIPYAEVKSLKDFTEALSSCEYVSFYCSSDMSVISVCIGQITYVIKSGSFSDEEFMQTLKTLFTGSTKLVMHNSKCIIKLLLSKGITANTPHFDTAVAAYLLSPGENSYPLENTVQKYLGIDMLPSGMYSDGENLTMFGSDESSEAKPEAYISESAAKASAILELYRQLLPAIEDKNLCGIMNNIELPLINVLAEMEYTGICIDKSRLNSFGKELSEKIDKTTQQIYELSGEEFNINSTKALGEILFDKLGLPHIKKTKTGYSTDIEVLNKLKKVHEIVPLIIEYREFVKLKSTYIDGLLKVIDPSDGKIHTTFEQLVTVTGRLSSTEPNLQNIPIRKSSGAEIRKMFVASEGCTLVDADYSQIELRVLAHISGDKNMIEAFKNGDDIHAFTASQVFNVPLSEVTPKMRSSAKAVNFGIVYGISEFSLADDIGVSRFEAKKYIEDYLSKYSGIKDYMDKIKQRAKNDGFVTTLFGRIRYLPELKSPNRNISSFGERAAMNTPIQGTAADIIKLAMIRVYNRLEKEKLKSKLILQIHDELILDCPKDEEEYVSSLLKEEMENAFQMKAPLLADVSSGESWYDAK